MTTRYLKSVPKSLQTPARKQFMLDTSTVSMRASATCTSGVPGRGIAHVGLRSPGNNKMAEQAQLTVLGSGPKGRL